MTKRALSTTTRLLATLLASGAVAVFAGPSGCGTEVPFGCGTDAEGRSAPCPDSSGVAPAKLIHELTAPEREAWCTWYVANLPPALSAVVEDPPAPAPLPNGTSAAPVLGVLVPASAASAARVTRKLAQVCLFELTVEECQQSLAAQPCAATVQQLDDCYRSALTAGEQMFGDGCTGLRASDSCDGTVIGLGHLTDPDPTQANSEGDTLAWCFARVK